jgi:hypothetical protein
MSDRPIDDLTDALLGWLTAVALQLDNARLKVLRRCLEADKADVYIVARLREGSIVLEGVNLANNTKTELWAESVEPLFPHFNAFGSGTSTKQ